MPKDKKSFKKKFDNDFKDKKRKDFDSRGDRDDRNDRPMYHATCATCGKSCEVPFRPSGERPVYCSTCFHSQGGGNDRSDRRPSFDNKPRFRQDRPMFHATCAKCGKSCDVPFVPTPGKTVYCKECFGQSKGDFNKPSETNNNSGQIISQLNTLNYKLDKILQALGHNAPKKEEKAVKSEKAEEKAVKTKKVVAKKTAKKKK